MRPWVRAGLVGAVVLVGACASDDDGGANASAGSTTAPPAPTGSTAPAPTTTTAPPQTPLPSGREAIDALLAAWTAGDRAGALLVASTEAVDALFAVPVEPAEDRGCNSGGVQVNVQCVFRLPSGELQVRAAPNLDGSGFLVDLVILGS